MGRPKKLLCTCHADLRRTLQETQTLDLAARSIHNVRYIKGVLWLYGCGIAKDLVPPNAHITRFLHECGYQGFGWSKEPADDWQIFTPACNCMKDVAKKVGAELKWPITPKQAQAAVWYLQTCRGLLPTNRKNQFTPSLLLDFLKAQNSSIPQLSDRLEDVEELGNLAEDLKGFLWPLRGGQEELRSNTEWGSRPCPAPLSHRFCHFHSINSDVLPRPNVQTSQRQRNKWRKKQHQTSSHSILRLYQKHVCISTTKKSNAEGNSDTIRQRDVSLENAGNTIH